jgi:hypothetical protein
MADAITHSDDDVPSNRESRSPGSHRSQASSTTIENELKSSSPEDHVIGRLKSRRKSLNHRDLDEPDARRQWHTA